MAISLGICLICDRFELNLAGKVFKMMGSWFEKGVQMPKMTNK